MLKNLLSKFRDLAEEKPRYIQPGPPIRRDDGRITYSYTVPPTLWKDLSPAMQKDAMESFLLHRSHFKNEAKWLESHRFFRAASEWWSTPIGRRLPGGIFAWWNTASNLWVGRPTTATDAVYQDFRDGVYYMVWHIRHFYGDGHEDPSDYAPDAGPNSERWASAKGLMDTMLACQGKDVILPDSKWYWQKSDVNHTTSEDFPTIEAAKADAERDYGNIA
jgi:hypothetical protein